MSGLPTRSLQFYVGYISQCMASSQKRVQLDLDCLSKVCLVGLGQVEDRYTLQARYCNLYFVKMLPGHITVFSIKVAHKPYQT